MINRLSEPNELDISAAYSSEVPKRIEINYRAIYCYYSVGIVLRPHHIGPSLYILPLR